MLNKIRRYFLVLKSDIKAFGIRQQLLQKEINEVNAVSQIAGVINNGAYLPFSKASLNYTSLAILLNDLVINNRRTVVEFGSGISTIAMARLMVKNNFTDRKIISVEHDKEWITIVQRLLEDEKLQAFVQLVYAPLVEGTSAIDGNTWYDTNAIGAHIRQLGCTIDCVLVDGPPAWNRAIENSRYPALPFLEKYLSPNCSVFLDDTNRTGEQRILKLWDQYGMKQINFTESFTGMFRGRFFDISLP